MDIGKLVKKLFWKSKEKSNYTAQGIHGKGGDGEGEEEIWKTDGISWWNGCLEIIK